MLVERSDEKIESFNKQRIVDSLVRETGLDYNKALDVATAVQKQLDTMNMPSVSASFVREMVCGYLSKNGLQEYRNEYRRLGVPFKDVTNIIVNGSKDNANLMHSPETIHKFVGDAVMKEYALASLPSNVVTAHLKGEIHLHDLDYFMVRPNCLQHDLRWFFQYGLKVDGTGFHTSSAAAPKHALTAILQAAKVLAASQTNMAGGQSLPDFSVLMAPYIKGLSYKEVKQIVQAFVFELNMMYVARGGQTVFSTVNIETSIPTYLEDKPAIVRGTTDGTYGDYYEENLTFCKALLEVLLEGDSTGKPHLFPNTILHVRHGTLRRPDQREVYYMVHQLFAKYGTPYIVNHLAEYQHDDVNYMGCRTRLSGDWADIHQRDSTTSTMRTGNLQYVTINLPRIALEAGGDYDKAINILADRLYTVKTALDVKHVIIERRLKVDNVLPFLSQQVNGEMYYRFDDVTHTVGFCGLNEFIRIITGKMLHESSDALQMGMSVIKHMRQWADHMVDVTKLRWTVTQSPAETTAGRFALLDLREYGDKAVINGPPSAPYYTNSSHIYVGADVPLFERARLEGEFHPLCNGGHITHLFMGEGMPNPEGLMSLTEKLCRHTNMGLFDYTKDITVCKKCGIVSGGLASRCWNCGASPIELEYYSRITGYCQRIGHNGLSNGGWNDAKISELRDRKRY